jgi:Zn-dependent oligopeptidase
MRMAKTSKAVADFLSKLSTRLEPLAQDELKVLLKLKEEEVRQKPF